MYASTALMIPLMTLLAVSTVRLIPTFGAIAMSLTIIRVKTPSLDFISKEISELENTNIILNQENEKEIKFFKNIHVKKVNFKYPNTNACSIIDCNLSINSGKKSGFIGNSGAGKSTFVNLLLGLLKPTEGKILIDGKDISENLRNWQSQIGYVSQDIYLLDDTIRNNIAFGKSGTSINSEHLLNVIKTAQLENFVNSLSNGEETIIGNRGVRISGGQKQRIGIARALYNKPRVLIFDEATSSLDLENERKIMDKIYQSNKELTFIIISHRNNTVKNCDLIYVFDNGKLIDKGSYEEILSKHNYLQERIIN
jgi:ATP-binding cassette subfamily C protein